MGAKNGFVDWKMEGALQARRLWKEGGETLDAVKFEPPKAPLLAQELTANKPNEADVCAYRRGYRHELHVMNLRKEALALQVRGDLTLLSVEVGTLQ